jgi:hypothetical protein
MCGDLSTRTPPRAASLLDTARQVAHTPAQHVQENTRVALRKRYMENVTYSADHGVANVVVRLPPLSKRPRPGHQLNRSMRLHGPRPEAAGWLRPTLHALARTRVQRKSGPWPEAWPLARLPGAPPEFRPPETHPSVGLGAAVQTRGKSKRHAARSRHVPVPNPPSASAHAWGTGRTEAWDRAKSF